MTWYSTTEYYGMSRENELYTSLTSLTTLSVAFFIPRDWRLSLIQKLYPSNLFCVSFFLFVIVWLMFCCFVNTVAKPVESKQALGQMTVKQKRIYEGFISLLRGLSNCRLFLSPPTPPPPPTPVIGPCTCKQNNTSDFRPHENKPPSKFISNEFDLLCLFEAQ